MTARYRIIILENYCKRGVDMGDTTEEINKSEIAQKVSAPSHA